MAANSENTSAPATNDERAQRRLRRQPPHIGAALRPGSVLQSEGRRFRWGNVQPQQVCQHHGKRRWPAAGGGHGGLRMPPGGIGHIRVIPLTVQGHARQKFASSRM